MVHALHVIGAVAEIFTWIGIGAGMLLGAAALVALSVDRSWHPVHVVIDREGEVVVARWFDDRGVGCAPLTPSQTHTVGDADALDAFARAGRLDRVRFTRRAPHVRALGYAALAFGALGAVTAAVQLVLLFVEG